MQDILQGEICRRNIFVIAADASAPNRIFVPYDFDQAGVIDAECAISSGKLEIKSVSQRLYRDNCVLNFHLPKAMEALSAARPEFEALFNDAPLLNTKYKRKALWYLDGSFAVSNSSGEFKK